MKTINLNEESPSISDLLAIARDKSVLIVSKEVTTFAEEADDFDREVAEFGRSERFMKFLEDRADENGTISIKDFAEGLAD